MSGTAGKRIGVSKTGPGAYRRLLVAMDGSVHAERALDRAIDLAKKNAGARITIVHVRNPDPSNIRTSLEAAKSRCEAAGIPMRRHILKGREYRQLVIEAGSGRYDLLLIGAKGLGANDEDAVGGICEMVARRCTIDTLVIRHPHETDGTGACVVAVDGSKHSLWGVRAALVLGGRQRRQIHLVTVYDRNYHQATVDVATRVLGRGHEALSDSGSGRVLRQEVDGVGLSRLSGLLVNGVAGSVSGRSRSGLEPVNLIGKPAVAIREFVAEKKATLLVVGAIGSHAEAGMNMGSVTDSLLSRSSCDLLICRLPRDPGKKRLQAGAPEPARPEAAGDGPSSETEPAVSSGKADQKTAQPARAARPPAGGPASSKGGESGTEKITVPSWSPAFENLLARIPGTELRQRARQAIQQRAETLGIARIDADSGLDLLAPFQAGAEGDLAFLGFDADERQRLLQFLDGWKGASEGKERIFADADPGIDRISLMSDSAVIAMAGAIPDPGPTPKASDSTVTDETVKRKILIADDEAFNREWLQEILSSHGACDLVEDGQSAVDHFKESLASGRPYDLICLDIEMPRKDGNEALKEVRALENEWGVPTAGRAVIIMTTSMDAPDVVFKSMGGGCNEYINKPIVAEELLPRISKHLSLDEDAQPRDNEPRTPPPGHEFNAQGSANGATGAAPKGELDESVAKLVRRLAKKWAYRPVRLRPIVQAKGHPPSDLSKTLDAALKRTVAGGWKSDVQGAGEARRGGDASRKVNLGGVYTPVATGIVLTLVVKDDGGKVLEGARIPIKKSALPTKK